MAAEVPKVKKKMGRPKGRLSTVTNKAREAAMAIGLLPHEWLLKVSRGEPIEQCRWAIAYDKNGRETSRELITEMIYPDPDLRIECAKAAAPYYAPRLAAHVVGTVKLPALDPEKLREVPTSKLDEFVHLMERLGVKNELEARSPVTLESGQ